MYRTNVSILLTIRNAEKDIGFCLTALLDQTSSDFEIIIVDDASTDKTTEIIKKFQDHRIKFFRNEKCLGLSACRNICLKNAVGDYVFFTDSDCVVSKNWIEEGLKILATSGCIGVEGKTYYVSTDYKPTRSDDVVENTNGGQYPTCNMAYLRSVLIGIGGFDERFSYMEDRDLAIRAKKVGKIPFNTKMIVYHRKKTYTPRQFVLKTGKMIQNRVLLYKKHKDKTFFVWRIWYPMNIVAILCPPLIIHSLLTKRFKTKEDFDLFPYIYISLVYERLNIWYTCAKEKVFLI